MSHDLCKITYYNITGPILGRFSRRETPHFLTISRFDFLVAFPTPLKRFYNIRRPAMLRPLPASPPHRPNKNRTLGEQIGRTLYSPNYL